MSRPNVAGKADGIGFMLATSNIGALDLDHCVDPATGTMAPWAAELDGECNGAYREVTVSGAGLRIIGTASGAEVHRRFAIDTETGAGLELYRNTARYITISGCEVGQCTELPPLDGLIDTLLTRYEGNGKAKSNGRRFDFNDAGPQSSVDYDEVIRNGAPNGQRSELFQACVWHLAAKGMSRADPCRARAIPEWDRREVCRTLA
jgi:primase-polymerase (primpol)-like protein